MSGKKTDKRSRWVQAVAARRHKNVAVVALANRMARTAYALLAREEDYQADHVHERGHGSGTRLTSKHCATWEPQHTIVTADLL